MGHLPKLIEDLALILVTGAITTLIFKKIKQPLVLGYIIAGLLVGPHFSITPTVADKENIETLAEIGVIFLLFSLGLEFSFKKLIRVGGASTITAFTEIVFIVTAGYFAGKWMGWSKMDSIFLGGMLASSSTTIIIRAFEEMGVKTKRYANVVFGVLVVEDIVVILLMVLLSTMAVSQQFEGGELLQTVLKLLFFLALWFIMGIFLLPTLLKKAKNLINDETLLILSIGLCLGMVILATKVGFSAELGAFIMGSIFAETTSAEKVEHIIKPVKDLFGAVFFISVGMMIDPAAMIEYKWPVLIVTLLTVFGKLFSTTIGAVLSGQSLKQSVQVGMSMAQIGEFAFIVATLGLNLGVISNFLFPVAVGASAITTFTTPYLIKYSEPFYNSLLRILPQRFVTAIENYSSGAQKIQAESTWKRVLGSYIKIVFINAFILLALSLMAFNVLVPFLNKNIQGNIWPGIVCLVALLGLGAPFLLALMTRKPDSMAYRELWLDEKYSKGPLLIIEVVRIMIGIALIGFWADKLISARASVLLLVPVAIAFLYLFSKRIQRFYQRIEGSFLTNLNARETAALKNNAPEEMLKKAASLRSQLLPWSAGIIDMEVNPNADYIGKTLLELGWREKYGINVAYIKRGQKLIHAPNRYNKLLPYDHAGIIATDEQMQMFKPVFENADVTESENSEIANIVLQKIVVDEYNRLKGLSIRESRIREKTSGLVIGIERGNERILNPDSSTVFEWDDVVWLVVDRNKFKNWQESLGNSA
ncbi:cation:proton antiporter domain-containing protein [Parafilimonas terrae]|uniref:Transporter, CPA2 family n=1 Tax=Parafilimonas terrae TaxID=1465490 RepID=A0A1I5RNH4_9BACT|nr:cation:proton antiporter [Parafilimonas terrae]SFP60098.1 transporter, CPA2 family [Parafilimonas terrae]